MAANRTPHQGRLIQAPPDLESPKTAHGSRSSRWAWRNTPLELVLPALAALTASAPLLLDPEALLGPDSFRTFDWLETAKLMAYSRVAILDHGTLPFWNPLLQGGFPQFTHPSDSSLSPLMLPTLLLGEALGMKINVILALIFGAVGTALLARDRLDLTPPLAAFAGCAFALCGWVPSRVVIGYYESALYAVFPLILWLFLQSTHRPWRLLATALLLALAALHVHLGMLVLLTILSVWTLVEVLNGSLGRGHLWRLPLVCTGAAALAAFKLIPMFDSLMSQRMRHTENYRSFGAFYDSPSELMVGLVQHVPSPGTYHLDGFPHLHDFKYVGLGVPLLLLAVLGLIFCWQRPRRMLAAGVLFLLTSWLCLGPFAPLDLFRPLWSLPLFHSMRGALRYFTFGLALAGCLLAAGGLQLLVWRVRRGGSLRRPLLLALALASLAWPGIQAVSGFHGSFTHPIPPKAPTGKAIHQEQIVGQKGSIHLGGHPRFNRGNTLIYRNMKAGVGTVYSPEDLPQSSSVQGARRYRVKEAEYRDNPAYKGEAYCPDHACTAEVLALEPNQIRVKARFQRTGLLLLNQNMSPGWTVTSSRPEIGLELVGEGGLLAAKVKATGEVKLLFKYSSLQELWTGLLIAAFALILGALLAARGRRSRAMKTLRQDSH